MSVFCPPMVYVLLLQQMMHIQQDEWGARQAMYHSSLIDNNKINMILLQIVVGCGCGDSWPLGVVCGCSCEKWAKKSQCVEGLDNGRRRVHGE